MPSGGDFIAAEVNAVLAQVAPDYIPVPSGDPIALALRVIAERLTGVAAGVVGGDQIGATFGQLVAKLGQIASSGDERASAVALLFREYGDAAGVPLLALLSPVDNRAVLSPITGTYMLKRAA